MGWYVWWLTDWSGKGFFLLLARLVWQGDFHECPRVYSRYIVYCENNILSEMIFLVADRLDWEGRFSLTSQTSLVKGIFTNAPD